MNFTTPIFIQKPTCTINYDSELLLLGSCFAENIGAKFEYFKFKTIINPFGIIFNAVSLENIIRRIVFKQYFTENDLFFHNDLWHSFEVHSQYSNTDKEQFLQILNKIIGETHNQLTTLSHCIITLGTSWVYRHNQSNTIVANCHKIPQKEFTKQLLSVDETAQSLKNTIDLLHSINPTIECVITISPERGPKATFDILDAQQKAVDALVKQGATHVTVDLPLIDDAFMIWSSLLADSSTPEHSFTAMLFGEYHVKHPIKALLGMAVKGKKSPHTLPLVVLTLLEQFPNLATGQRKHFVQLGHQLKKQLNDVLGDDGVLVMPVFPEVAPRHGAPIFKPFDFVDCAIVNAMELPATAVPMGLNAGGIPTGIQVVSNQNNDHLSLACALALEKATGGWVAPWHSWLADLPNSVFAPTPAKKASPRCRQTLGAE